MLGYTVRKLAHTHLVALGVVTLAFGALRLSGDPAATMLPGDASVEELAALRQELGLDRPIPVQYVQFLRGAVTGDFGTSFRHQQPALPLVLERLPATLELTFAALFLTVVIALPLGIVATIIHDEKPWLELFQEVIAYGVAKRVTLKPRSDYRLLVAEMTVAP